MKNTEIGDVLKRGKSYRTDSFLIRFLPSSNPSNTPTLLNTKLSPLLNKPAFIASKKIFKTAVIRNKVRRKMKAAAQALIKSIKNKYKIVFILNDKILKTTLSELKNETENVLIKSGMLKI